METSKLYSIIGIKAPRYNVDRSTKLSNRNKKRAAQFIENQSSPPIIRTALYGSSSTEIKARNKSFPMNSTLYYSGSQ